MNEKQYYKLVEKLNSYIDNDGVDTSVSPTLGVDESFAPSTPLLITSEMDVMRLDEKDLPLVHVLLHKFYMQGGTKLLNKKDIEKLHIQIKKRIIHSDFDNLDIK